MNLDFKLQECAMSDFSKDYFYLFLPKMGKHQFVSHLNIFPHHNRLTDCTASMLYCTNDSEMQLVMPTYNEPLYHFIHTLMMLMLINQ